MNHYTLDYSDSRPDERLPNRRLRQSHRQAVLLVCALIGGFAFVAAVQLQANARLHQVEHRAQAIRYDSLLTAKAEADSQLRQLRNLLARTSPNP